MKIKCLFAILVIFGFAIEIQAKDPISTNQLTDTPYTYTPGKGICVKPNLYLNQVDADRIKSWGVELVRITMSENPLLNFNAPYNVNESSLNLLKDRVALSKSNGFRVLIDPHAYPGCTDKFTMRPTDEFWSDLKFHDAAVELWKRIATEFKKEGPYIEYDLFNEPIMFEGAVSGSARDYFGLVNRVISEIRAIDTTHYIHIETPWVVRSNSQQERLFGINYFPQFSDKKIVYHLHYYNPTELINFDPAAGSGMSIYPGRDSHGVMWNKDKIRSQLQDALRVSTQHGVPVFFGEFHVTRAVGVSALRWTKDLLDLFSEFGWGYSWHIYRSGADKGAADLEKSLDINDQKRYTSTPMLEIMKQAWNGLPIVIPPELTGLPDNMVSETRIYPTITEGIINISPEEKIKSIKLYSITGTTIKNWSNTNTIDISDQSKGFYLLQLFDLSGNATTYKVVKQ